ncbi:multidrug and toxin extrusion protein 2 [Stylonychia lemnae]|uniref:Multidrug and toxin extrusion protein 2 n=1 Tax=Stylonychia lemnae TaxID=5949 RepID=A0A078A7A3_STYLE|nr:multidrug and toxin extrusion protein 2 [Stylonychia lemnae]|eukprot:CDW78129.1 multidrug and toxin extrusion protein 2 [Stylonychia lemnae]
MDRNPTKEELNQPLLTQGYDTDNERHPPLEKRESKDDEDLSFWKVMRQITDLSIYPIVGMLFHPAYHLVNTVILGQDDDAVNSLATFGLATVTIGISLMSVQISFNNSLTTLISQLILNFIVFIPICLLLLFVEYFFLGIGQQAEVASRASFFIKVLLPGFFCYGIFHTYSKYLAGQKEVRFDEESFRNLWPQMKMSLYSCGMIIWGWWAFDVFTFIGTFMSLEVMAAQTVCRNIVLIFYMIPVGLSQASSVMVGNMIGKKNIQGARVYGQMCSLTSFAWGCASVLVMAIFGEQIVRLFSSSESVRNLVTEAFLMIWLYILFDCLQCIGAGIISGLGRQGKGSILTVFGFWALGIPLALVQTFYYNMGIIALWLGPLVAITFNSFAYYAFILKIDLKEIVREAEERRLREKKRI